jgi:hypothetical protein
MRSVASVPSEVIAEEHTERTARKLSALVPGTLQATPNTPGIEQEEAEEAETILPSGLATAPEIEPQMNADEHR